jgi:hypothetical protein
MVLRYLEDLKLEIVRGPSRWSGLIEKSSVFATQFKENHNHIHRTIILDPKIGLRHLFGVLRCLQGTQRTNNVKAMNQTTWGTPTLRANLAVLYLRACRRPKHTLTPNLSRDHTTSLSQYREREWRHMMYSNPSDPFDLLKRK